MLLDMCFSFEGAPCVIVPVICDMFVVVRRFLAACDVDVAKGVRGGCYVGLLDSVEGRSCVRRSCCACSQFIIRRLHELQKVCTDDSKCTRPFC